MLGEPFWHVRLLNSVTESSDDHVLAAARDFLGWFQPPVR